jgi:hypothetical protein
VMLLHAVVSERFMMRPDPRTYAVQEPSRLRMDAALYP